MQKRKSNIGIWLGIVAMGLAIIFALLWLATEQHRAAQVAQVPKPLAIDAFKMLRGQIYGEESVRPDELAGPTAADLPLARLFSGSPDDWAETIEGYRNLFADVQAVSASIDQDLSEILYQKQPDEWTTEEKSKVAEFILANQDMVLEIRRMATRGTPVYPLDLSKGAAVELPHLAQLRSCARLLRQDASVKVMQGNKAEAVEDIIAGMKLGDALAPEPILISQLVRIAVYGIMYQTLQDCFYGADLSPELTRRLMTQIAQADNHGAFAEAMYGEVYMGLDMFSDVRVGNTNMPQILGGEATSIGEIVFLRLYGSPLGRPLLNMDEASYVDIMTRTARAAESPYYRGAQELQQIENDFRVLPRARVLTRIIASALGRACEAQARHEAMLDLVQLGILIEQYEAQNGSFPAALDDIAAELGGPLPVDPFTGNNYHYVPYRETFLLYSVGRNRRDDRGRHDFTSGDVVWRGKEDA